MLESQDTLALQDMVGSSSLGTEDIVDKYMEGI